MKPDFAKIVKQFKFEGDFLEVRSHEFGHIHDTYVVRFRKANGGERRFLLQRINHNVFKTPAAVMQNIEKVTTHLRKKIITAGGNPERETLNLIPTVEGKNFYKTPGGNYWRAYIFIEGARTYEVVQSVAHVYHAATAFGQFQKLLSDFPVEQLYETIPDFHHTPQRFETFVETAARDVKNRARSAQEEIEFVEKRVQDTSVLLDLFEQGNLPQRVTHNDTKFDNVMIDDQTGEGICVIDLDTVMPGLFLYDFGDSVRSAANSAAEDERELAKVCFRLDIFDRLTQGYLDIGRDILTPLEMDYMSFSAKLITLEQGMRFLTDHLAGDVYYKIHRENHNLDRCRTQFKLVKDMEEKFDQMVSIVKKHRQQGAGLVV
ncbi:phosphotransferase enzyme family protein [Chloroflexota bacterium]